MLTKDNSYQSPLIVALDFSDFSSAKNMVMQLGKEVGFYKIGLEMLMSGDYFKMLNFLKEQDKKIFVDLKFYDIPATVGKAIKNLQQYNIDLTTIHVANREIMLEASQNKGDIKILGVTVLTSFEKKDLIEMNFDQKIEVEELVVNKTKLALDCGLDGVVSSALEAKILRQNFGNNFLIVTPGIRLESSKDDQKRVSDVKNAIANKVSYLVVGRPITKNENPVLAAQKFNQLIGAAYAIST